MNAAMDAEIAVVDEFLDQPKMLRGSWPYMG